MCIKMILSFSQYKKGEFKK